MLTPSDNAASHGNILGVKNYLADVDHRGVTTPSTQKIADFVDLKPPVPLFKKKFLMI